MEPTPVLGLTEMIKGTEGKADEKFALGLLERHLTDREAYACRCEINVNDPPDLIVTWKGGKCWGVEVTRMYQRVEQIGDTKSISSVETVIAHLRSFADELEQKTERIRQYGYTLYLEAPGPFSSWRRSMPSKQWKKETEKLIQRHIASGERGKLQFPGGGLIPGEPGDRWSSLFGSPTAELESCIAAMLSQTLADKTKRLQDWKGKFDQCWLLLLNCYPLASGTAEIQGALHRLVCENTELAGFDGVFWSGFPDRTLFPISLSQISEGSRGI